MDMLKFVMVIFISDPSKFGYPAKSAVHTPEKQ
jgi:hypothetical protein